jgi:O-antigen biosynthesis protein
MKLSIIIPAYNNWSFTKSCLDVFSKLPNDIELITIDNGSTDDTKDYPCSIRNETNFGFGYACDQGWEISRGECVMFLNNDIMFSTKKLDWLYKYIEDIKDNELVGPTGGFVDPKNDFAFVYETDDRHKKINYLSGWCITATRNTWENLTLLGNKGPFDHNTYFSYYEDTDASFRAAKLGMKFRLKPVPLFHVGKQTSKLINMSSMYLESKNKFIKRWKS